jgi:hypothetical protein
MKNYNPLKLKRCQEDWHKYSHWRQSGIQIRQEIVSLWYAGQL